MRRHEGTDLSRLGETMLMEDLEDSVDGIRRTSYQ
jgi:hypothetical protein